MRHTLKAWLEDQDDGGSPFHCLSSNVDKYTLVHVTKIEIAGHILYIRIRDKHIFIFKQSQ